MGFTIAYFFGSATVHDLEYLYALCDYESMPIQIARIYDASKKPGEYRILIDRLWPRGVSKEKAALDVWAKDIAPSAELREWFSHKPERFAEFFARYERELDNNPALPDFIATLKVHPNAVLLYAAKDPHVNHAMVLQKYLVPKLR